MQKDIPEETDLVLDQPRDTDYEYQSLFWSTESSNMALFLPPSIQNQWTKYKTRMACSRYGICHAINAQNLEVSKKDLMRFYEIPWESMWENYLKVNPKAEQEWATLQSAMQQMLELSLITGYSRLNSQEDMKASIRAIRPIYTGSQNGEWNLVRDEHRYALRTDGRVVGHIFCIVGYNESSWIAINSYWANNWVFYIPFDLTNTLFTRYSISDSRDTEVFSNI